jgi:hypothetical protein
VSAADDAVWGAFVGDLRPTMSPYDVALQIRDLPGRCESRLRLLHEVEVGARERTRALRRRTVVVEQEEAEHEQAAPAGAACPQVVVAYRHHPENMSRQRGAEGVEEFEYLREKYSAALEWHDVDASRKPGYRYFARAQLQAGRRLSAATIFASLAVKERSPADLGRALAAIVLGEGVTDSVARLRPRLRPSPAEIEALLARSPEEIGWLRSLTGDRVDWLGERDSPRLRCTPETTSAWP